MSGGWPQRGRRGVVTVVAVSVVVVGLAVGVVTEVAADELPGWLGWLAVGSRAWWLLGALLVAGAGLAVLSLRADGEPVTTPALTVGHQGQQQTVHVIVSPQQQPVPVVARHGQLIVGELPSAPPAFVERAAVGELVAAFAAGSGGTVVVCAVGGGRGVGKSQTAAAYARLRASQGCQLVGWASAATTQRLWSDLAEIATAVGVADPEGDSKKSAQRLRTYLQGRADPSVLVIDNATDPDAVRPLLPVMGRCEVVVTSTDQAFEQLGHPVAVRPFHRAESTAYLRSRTGMDDDGGAGQVADALGDLPVALAHAATVIHLRRWSYDEYVQALADLPASTLLPHDAGNPYPQGAAQALLLSVKTLEQTEATSLTCRILQTVAFLAPEGVHRTLLATLITGGDHPVGGILDEQLAHLVRASVLAWAEEGGTVTAHRLLNRVLRDRALADGTYGSTVTALVDRLGRLLPEDDAQAWRERHHTAAVAQHGLATFDFATTRAIAFNLGQLQQCVQLANRIIRHLVITSDLSAAIATGARVVRESERVLGPDHPDTLRSRSNLAGAYRSAGQLNKAIPLLEATLTDRERILGTDHPDTLRSRNNLSYAYQSAGQLNKAILLLQAALSSRKEITPLFERRPTILTCVNLIRSRFVDLLRLLTDRERILGTDHPTTIRSRNNLALAYQSAGQLNKAILVLQATLTACERILGTDHPDTLTSRNNLALAYRSAGQLNNAIPLLQATLTDSERILGTSHPDTLTSRNNLALAYQSAGQPDKAIPLLQATLTDSQRVLGPDHPLTKTIQINLHEAQQASFQ